MLVFLREFTALGLFQTKTLIGKTDHDFLSAPEAPAAREPKQRRMMVVALVLLLVALGFVLYRDRDFWFPDSTDDADDQLEQLPVTQPVQQQTQPVQAAAQSKATTVAKAPAPVKKSHSKHSAKDADASTSAPIETANASVAPQTPTQPVNAATRTELPSLEVEVVAGDNHRVVLPGTNSVHVDLQPGSPPQPVTNTYAASAPPPAPAVTEAAERVQMSSGAAEVISHHVNPDYPLLARQMKVQGSVILEAMIGRDGTIQGLQVLTGPPILANAAEEAVRQWRFKPHYMGSEAVETQTKITVNFTISTN
jgi:TonB family protein